MTTMEDLTKTQIILLTLLISFVTSVATGIITTSLLAEAPVGVTQTINRVVEHTIEKVAPEAPGTTVKEVTIVKEEDAVIDAIDKATASLVRVYAAGGNGSFYGLGIVVTEDGFVLTDNRNVTPGTDLELVFTNGTRVGGNVAKVDDTYNISLIRILPGQVPRGGFPVVELSENDAKLGQSVIAIEGEGNTVVALGRVTAINQGSNQTDINPLGEIAGSPLLNLSGELIGLKGSTDDLVIPQGTYVSLPILKSLIESR